MKRHDDMCCDKCRQDAQSLLAIVVGLDEKWVCPTCYGKLTASIKDIRV